MLDGTINNYKVEHPEELPALALAYIGDAVFELQVRMLLINLGTVKVNQLHKDAVKVVRAKNQAAVIHAIENELSEEEKSIVRRGRNAKSGRSPKNTDIIVYRYSTAFETLIGYLYLKGRYQRVHEIIEKAYEIANNK
jgi:ribonuclease III family protein